MDSCKYGFALIVFLTVEFFINTVALFDTIFKKSSHNIEWFNFYKDDPLIPIVLNVT